MLRAGETWAGVFNLSMCMIGSGALALPYGLRLAGPAWGFALLALSAWLGASTLRALCVCTRLTRQPSYDALIRHCLGPRVEQFASLVMIVEIGLVCVAFLDVAVDSGYEVLTSPAWGVAVSAAGLRGVLALCMCVASLPRRLSSLRYTSGLGLAALVFIMSILITRAAQGPRASSVPALLSPRRHRAHGFQGPVYALMLQLASYGAIFNSVRMQAELPAHLATGGPLVIAITAGVATVFYVAYSLAGYVCFDGAPPDDVLQGFHSDRLVDSARLVLMIVMVLKTPLLVQPLRMLSGVALRRYLGISSCAEDGGGGDDEPATAGRAASAEEAEPDDTASTTPPPAPMPPQDAEAQDGVATAADVGGADGVSCWARLDKGRYVLTPALLACIFCGATALPSLGKAIAYLSATSNGLLMFILPGLCLRSVLQRAENKRSSPAATTKRDAMEERLLGDFPELENSSSAGSAAGGDGDGAGYDSGQLWGVLRRRETAMVLAWILVGVGALSLPFGVYSVAYESAHKLSES